MNPLLRYKKNHLIDYSIIAVLVLSIVGYPLISPLSIIFEVPNRFISIPFRTFILLLSLAIIIKYYFFRCRFPFTPFWFCWWAFWAIYISRMILDAIFNQDVLRLPLSEYLLYAIGVSLLPSLVVFVKVNHVRFDKVPLLIVLLGVLGAIFNFLVLHHESMIFEIATFLSMRQETETLNPISLSHLGLTIIVLSAWKLVQPKLQIFIKYFLVFAFCVGIITLLAGASRGPLFCLFVEFLLLGFIALKNLSKKNIYRIILIALLIITMVIFAIVNYESVNMFRRAQESIFLDDRRTELMYSGWDLFLNNILLGAGTEPLGYYPHNAILESFLLSGIFSGLLFLGLLVLSLVYSLKIIIKYRNISWVSLLYFQFIMASMFSGALYDSGAMWVSMVLVVSCYEALQPRNEIMLHKDQAVVVCNV